MTPESDPALTPEVPPDEGRITGLRALRLVCIDVDRYERTCAFYRELLGPTDRGTCGGDEDSQRATAFRLAEGLDLIIALEIEPPPEAFLTPGPVWLCFQCEGADAQYEAAQASGCDLLNEPIDTAFGTRAFYANDPDGRPVYVGTPWPRP
jgi:predicted enzyme related to lactoylglutathione lyase